MDAATTAATATVAAGGVRGRVRPLRACVLAHTAVPVWLPSDGCEPSETEKESRVLASFSTLLMNRSQSVRLLVLTCLLALASGPARAASDHPVILIVGDSISAGFGVPVQQGYATLLEQQLQEHMAAS